MALIDDVKITVKAGNGGNGGKSFKTLFGSGKRKPDGGNGGRGGDVYFQASNNVSDLSQFRFQKKLAAEDGNKGMNKDLDGKKGEDLLILVPLGTRIINEETEEEIELSEITEPVLIAQGGRGGSGTHDYKPNIRNYETRQAEGGVGEEKQLHLILNLIAQIGLVGLPNAGKSSLLTILTNAAPKVGNYPFTTLEPNLGVFEKLVIADIPGLIEGASHGKGLGITFLKHIEKTQMLLHCIDATEKDVVKIYETVRHEFEEFSPALLEKKEIILLTKIDLVDETTVKNQVKLLKKFKKKILPLSIYDEKSINKLKKILTSGI